MSQRVKGEVKGSLGVKGNVISVRGVKGASRGSRERGEVCIRIKSKI